MGKRSDHGGRGGATGYRRSTLKPARLPQTTRVAVVAVGWVLAASLTGAGASGAGRETPGPGVLGRLQAISSTEAAGTTSVVIEATDPVPYLTTRPDPLTVLIDLRNVETDGVVNTVRPRGSIARVTVEESESLGVPMARVRVTLTKPVPYRVLSTRNVIRMDVAEEGERSAAAAGTRPRERALPPATTIASIRAARDGRGVRIVVAGNGRLAPGSVEPARDLPPRLVLDFPGVKAAVSRTTPINLDPVLRVRVARHSDAPLVTRVVVDLDRWVEPRLETSEADGAVAIVFGDPLQTSGGAAGMLQAPRSVVDPPIVLPDPEALVAQRAEPEAPATGAVPPASFDEPKPGPIPVPQGVPLEPPPAPPQPSRPAGTPQAVQEKKFTGQPMSFALVDADLHAVLNAIAQEAGLNLAIDPKVEGRVNLQVTDVPWDQILDIILKQNGLGYTIEGNVVRIAPMSALAAEEEERRKVQTAQELAGTPEVATIPLSYAKAEEVATLIQKNGVALTQRGAVNFDPRTNMLIITDLPAGIQKARAIIARLDVPQPQVEIEARIVQTNRNFLKDIGVRWGINARAASELGNTLPLTFPNQGSVTGRTGGGQGPGATPSVVNLPVQNPAGAAGILLGSVNGAIQLDMELSALERKGQGRLLSAPRVTTQNNVEAEMTQGVEIPIQTVANNTVTVTFRPAALTLKVTPQITAAGTVIMQVSIENAAADFTKSVNGIPPINTQRAITTVLVNDGETTVLGGINLSTEQAQTDRTPGLGSIPILNWLFKKDRFEDENRELVVFITPRIVKQPAAARNGQ